ncbi:MAG: ribonuclease III domain-containing protein [Solirubrobacterales bacterium]
MLELAELIAELPAELRQRALTHHTWVEDRADSYRPLAFLGDSVLGLALAAKVHERFPKLDSGRLTPIFNQAISGVSCAAVGRELGVPEMLEAMEKPSKEKAIPMEVLRDTARPVPEMTEALIGACFLTFGFERTRDAVVAAFAPRIEFGVKFPHGAKGHLHKLVARQEACLSYDVSVKAGPSYYPIFKAVAMADSEPIGEGEGRSKKAAELAAAEQALERLELWADA